VPAAYRDRWHILDLVTGSPWWIWVICGLVLALLIALEGVYKTVTVREATIADLTFQLEAALPQSLKLSEAAKELLLVAAIQDPNGQIVRFTSSLGPSIQSNGKVFNEGHDPRETARWEAALKELEALGLVEAVDYNRVVFKVTNEGYEVARSLG
jgi:hypothetical protein